MIAVFKQTIKTKSIFGEGRFLYFSTRSTETVSTPSNRQLFREIPVHPSIFRYIKSIGVGIPPRLGRRKRRVSSDVVLPGKGEFRPGGTNPPPAPFGPDSFPVKVVGQSSEGDPPAFPENPLKIPEVAVAGRSNVGKSTLLNALLYGNRVVPEEITRKKRGTTPDAVKMPKGVKAITSPRPGETKRLTFFQLKARVDSRRLWLVDLPGYGFAFAKDSEGLKRQITDYLLHRGKILKRVLLLIDARHGMKKSDMDFLDELQKSSPPGTKFTLPPIQIVLTKCDLVQQADLARRVVQVREQLSDCLRREPSQLPVMLVSARAGVGFNKVRHGRIRGGVIELQKELAALAVTRAPKKPK